MFTPSPHSLTDLNPEDCTLLAFLGVSLASSQIGQLHDLFNARPKKEIIWLADQSRRNSTSLSLSDYSSLRSILSRLSYNSSESTTSQLQGSVAFSPYTTVDECTTPLTQSSPYPTLPAVQGYDCVACKVTCTNQVTSSKHQKEKCENKTEWICPSCLPERRVAKHLQERIEQHHLNVHGDKCENGCPKNGTLSKLSKVCKEQLSQCSQPVPQKVAWGCPCCHACFSTFDEWNSHANEHRKQPDWTEHWSKRTLITSLLHQHLLIQASSVYDWTKCSWSDLKDPQFDSLRFALERWSLPPDVKAHQDYYYLDTLDALALYAFRLGNTKKAFEWRTLSSNANGTSMPTMGQSFSAHAMPNYPFLAHPFGSSVSQDANQIGSLDSPSHGFRPQTTHGGRAGSHQRPLTTENGTPFDHHLNHSDEITGAFTHTAFSADRGPFYTNETHQAAVDQVPSRTGGRRMSHSLTPHEPMVLKAKRSFQSITSMFSTKSSKSGTSEAAPPPPVPSPRRTMTAQATAHLTSGSEMQDVLSTSVRPVTPDMSQTAQEWNPHQPISPWRLMNRNH